jgi:predicted deacylase
MSRPTATERYPRLDAWLRHFGDLAARAGGRASIAGRSVEGRPIPRFDFGPEGAPAVLLTGGMHGSEYIGSLALLDAVRSLSRAPLPARLVVLPAVNPDALDGNAARLRRGLPAFRRGNSRGVDLNRNFPHPPGRRSLHPFAGSSWRHSLHYVGPHPLSEPESRAVADVADEVRPSLSLAFHSFGELLLYPWAHTRAPHPRSGEYRALGGAFARAQSRPYRVMPARGLYPTIGDLDDWLDARHGTLALTVEVGRLDRRLLDPRCLLQPFWWMNPTDVESTLSDLTPAVCALVRAAFESRSAAPFENTIAPPRVALAAASK